MRHNIPQALGTRDPTSHWIAARLSLHQCSHVTKRADIRASLCRVRTILEERPLHTLCTLNESSQRPWLGMHTTDDMRDIIKTCAT